MYDSFQSFQHIQSWHALLHKPVFEHCKDLMCLPRTFVRTLLIFAIVGALVFVNFVTMGAFFPFLLYSSKMLVKIG